MRCYVFTTVLFLLCCITFTDAQNLKIKGAEDDESDLYARTKQVNQFFRRFNSEEDLTGKRLDPSDSLYRNQLFRRQYIRELFDKESTVISPELKESFIYEVTDFADPKYLDFHAGNWISEVQADFNFNGKNIELSLFFVLEKENGGSKWVIKTVYFEEYAQRFKSEDEPEPAFIHPLSHEIDFMNLRKAFRQKEHVQEFAQKTYVPDHLTLFFNDIKKGRMSFIQVTNVKFHILQIEHWYFELSEYNRKGYNAGWLISNLIKVPEKEKGQFIKFIYHELE
jgi:hypothetical protein